MPGFLKLVVGLGIGLFVHSFNTFLCSAMCVDHSWGDIAAETLLAWSMSPPYSYCGVCTCMQCIVVCNLHCLCVRVPSCLRSSQHLCMCVCAVWVCSA